MGNAPQKVRKSPARKFQLSVSRENMAIALLFFKASHNTKVSKNSDLYRVIEELRLWIISLLAINQLKQNLDSIWRHNDTLLCIFLYHFA